MKKITQLVVVVIVSLTCGANLSAGMIYKSVNRSIFGNGTQLETEEQSTETMSPFTTDLLNSGYVRDEAGSIVGSVSAFASQSSTVTDNQIRGLARGSGFGSGGAEGIGRSEMSIDFETDQSMRFTLTGQLRLAPHGEGIELGGSEAYIRLTGPSGVAMEVMMDGNQLPDTTGAIDFSGSDRLSQVLPAGDYTLEAFAEGHGDNGKTRCVDFDFTFTALEAIAVPEPGSYSLGLLAVVGFATIRRRR